MNIQWDTATFRPGDFRLFDQSKAAPILVDESDFDVVQIAAKHFAGDVERVTGAVPFIVTSPRNLSDHIIIAGTIGQSRWINLLVEQGKLNAVDLTGLWESFVLQIVDDPFPGVETGLVIAGSDRRGTAYGIFELSEQIGVSPWYWWADVATVRRKCVVVTFGKQQVGPPAVKYRGIFINDEDWSLREWASLTFAPDEAIDQKGFGPSTYAKVFELMLRLRANLLWPAMHPGTKPFNDYPENKILADRYAIIMGSSHCEPMLRNNVGEWDLLRDGEWNFTTNRERMMDYWTERARENGRYENIYTLGMRGIHDDPMPGGTSLAEQVQRLANVFEVQRGILSQYANTDVASVPQILCVYKEVLDLYHAGLQVPSDVTIIFSDDNYGYLTHLPSPAERKQGRKAGIYYHISYWGRPHDYLWLCSTPLALIWSEMHKAFLHGANDLWIVNVGGLKAHEIGTEYFLRLAWNADNWDVNSPRQFLIEWAKREFENSQPEVLADLLTEFMILAFARKPEHMGWSKVYPETQNKLSELSPANYGDELQRYLDRYAAVVRQLDRLYQELSQEKREAFYQMVVYPVRCASLMSQKFLYAQKSLFYANQGRYSAAHYASLSRQAFEAIQAETNYYNTRIANGKWQHIMCCQPRNLPVFGMPPVYEVPQLLASDIGIVVEGAELPGSLAGEHSGNNWLPSFSRFTQKPHFFDIYDPTGMTFRWNAVASATWIQLSAIEGSLESEQRIWVTLDWASVPQGDNIFGDIIVTGADKSETLKLHVFNPVLPENLGDRAIVESNGVISVHAARFTRRTPATQPVLQVVPGLGRTGEAVSCLSPITDRGATGESFPVVLEYRMYLFTTGSYMVHCHCLPTHPRDARSSLLLAISFDEQPAQQVNIAANGGEFDKVWQENVLRGAVISNTRHNIEASGWHTLKIALLDMSIVMDKIVVDTGGMKSSYFGPPETLLIAVI